MKQIFLKSSCVPGHGLGEAGDPAVPEIVAWSLLSGTSPWSRWWRKPGGR